MTYYWKVCVWDADGNSYWIDGNKSNYWSFTTKKSSVAKPSNPSSPSPSDGATNVSTSGNLSWSCGGTDFNNSCSYSNLQEGQTYYWKVCVWDSDGNTYWIGGDKSNYWSFTTKMSSVAKPSNPSSPSPSNGATNVSTSGSLSWSCGGTDFNYDLYLATDANFKNRVGGTDAYRSGRGNSCSYSNLQEGQTYYWKVCVWDSDGNTYWIGGDKSKYWNFTTAKSSSSSLGTFDFNTINVSNLTSTGVTVSWGEVSGATSYDVRLYTAGTTKYILGSGTPGRVYCSFSGLTANTNYEICIRAKNSSHTGAWSDRYTVKTAVATSNNEQTETADLYLYKENGFNGTTVFEVGDSYLYRVGINNNSSSEWYGNIILKVNGEDEKIWTKRLAPKVSYLEYVYKPKEKGDKTITIYYQTSCTGKGREINKGSEKNPFTITVTDGTTENSDIKMASSVTCSPNSFEIGGDAVLKASIVNDGGADWTGVVAFTDNGNIIRSKKATIHPGVTSTYQCTWCPTQTGNHEIGIKYENSKGVLRDFPANGYSISVNANISAKQEASTPSVARINLITKDLAPTEVNPGTEVYYHFRITDSKGNPLPGVTATFNCTGSNYFSQFNTSVSDDNGVASLALKTFGTDKIAERGQTVNLSCVSFDNGVELDVANSDSEIKLKIHEMHAGGLFENIETVKVGLDRGATAILGEKDIASLNGSLSMPMKVGLKWNNQGSLESFSIDSEIKASVNSKVNMWDYINSDLGGEAGMKSSSTFKTSSNAAVIVGLLTLCETFYLGTSRLTLFGAKVIDRWFNKNRSRFENYIGTSDSFFAGYYLDMSVKSKDLFAKFPGLQGALTKTLKGPASWLLPSKFEAGGKVALKFEPWKEKDDSKYGRIYGDSRSLSIKLNGVLPELIEPLFFNNTNLSWWRSADIARYYARVAGAETILKTGSSSGTFTATEEEMYTSPDKKTLQEISNTVEITSTKKVDIKDFKIIKDWIGDNGKANASMSTSLSSKFTSKGPWAAFLQRESANNSDLSKLFPVLSGESIISSPMSHYNVIHGDFISALEQIKVDNPNQYSISDALKVEQQVKSKGSANVSIPLKPGKIFKFTMDLGLSLELNNYPSTSYYSVSDRRFFPVVLNPTATIGDIASEVTERIARKINSAFSGDEDELDKTADEVGSAFETDENGYIKFGAGEGAGGGGGDNWVRRRHPKLAEMNRTDVCKLDFTLNEESPNFDSGTNIKFTHFYPSGDLLGVTDKGDTLFVVSEVAELSAVYNNNQLKTTHNGYFKLDSYVGADDLTPFGFPEDQALDVYHANEGSDIWHYVGPAGSTLQVDSLGAYILATSLQNDKIAPEIIADLDLSTGLIHIAVSDNIGVRSKSIQVVVNGDIREAVMVNESNFFVQLFDDDLEYKIDVYITIYDVAGNKGEARQTFNPELPAKVNIEDQPDTDITEIENTVYAEMITSAAGNDVTLSVKMKNSVEAESFQFDLELPKGVTVVTDEDGFAEADLSLERTTKRKTDTFSTSFLENGTLRVIAGSTGGHTFSGNDGEVATINLHIDNNVAAGYYPIVLRNISISDTEAVSHDVAYVKSSIYVGEELIGDVNGDNVVNAQDVVALVNYMMGKMQLDFNAADVNGDGVVNIADAIMVSNAILKQ